MTPNKKSIAFLSVTSLIALSCTAVGQTLPNQAAGGGLQACGAAPAAYEVRIETVWSPATHPAGFPGGAAFFTAGGGDPCRRQRILDAEWRNGF